VVVDGTIVRGFAKAGTTGSAHLFVGVQVAEAEVFASLPDNVPAESVGQVYPALIAARPGSIRAFVTEATFFDIGTPVDYLGTYLRLAPGESRTPESRLQECIVWDDVEVGQGARLRRCIVTDGVRIPAGSTWENMTIRVAHGELMTSERLIGELAIGPVDGTTVA